MINDIIQAIAVRLNKMFSFKVYIDKVPQGFQSPCFQIKVISTSETQIVDFRHKAETVLDINYITGENARDRMAAYDVTEKLNGILDLITLENGDVLRGNDRNTEIQDDSVHSFVRYTYIVYKERKEEEKMESLDHKGGIKK